MVGLCISHFPIQALKEINDVGDLLTMKNGWLSF